MSNQQAPLDDSMTSKHINDSALTRLTAFDETSLHPQNDHQNPQPTNNGSGVSNIVQRPKPVSSISRQDNFDDHHSTPRHPIPLGGKPSSFAQLVRSWETYISDGPTDPFQPLQMFHQLNLCGTAGEGFARLPGPAGTHSSGEGTAFEPISFKHARSSPLRHTPSMLDDEADLACPIGLRKTNRSRSTPLSTSANSAFGKIWRTMPYVATPEDRSGFLLPDFSSYTTPMGSQEGMRYSAFNPIPRKNESDETELTSIEVMDVTVRDFQSSRHAAKEVPDSKQQYEEDKHRKDDKQGAPSRAARFLSDVRVLRRRRRIRGGRENPAQPSSSDDSGKKTDVPDEGTISSKSSSSLTHDKSMASVDSIKMCSASKDVVLSIDFPKKIGKMSKEERISAASRASSYHPLDSDVDEEVEQFHRLNSSMDVDSPATIPSPAYEQILDDRPASRFGRQGVRIQVSQVTKRSVFLHETDSPSYSTASPSPPQMSRDGSSLTGTSHDSPGTMRSLGTTNTSGHTTQASSTTGSSGMMSQLSSISETDREVMEANTTNIHLRNHPISSTAKSNHDMTDINSSSTGSTDDCGYLALSNSPDPLRDGANVPAERFFTFSESQVVGSSRPVGRLRSSISLKKCGSLGSHSPTTASSSSMTTNSSASSSGDEPPTFVSTFDRKLTSLREGTEANSPRDGGADHEERESPSEILGYNDVIFEEAMAPGSVNEGLSRPVMPSKGRNVSRRIRSLPPRSPGKGRRTPTTPPPRAGRESVSPLFCLSPPRNIVDHRLEANVSRPYVLRSTPTNSRVLSRQKLVVISPEVLSSTGAVNYTHLPGVGDDGSHEVIREVPGHDMSSYYYMSLQRSSPNGYLRSRTYDEHSIEILKTDSKEDSHAQFVSPEKRMDEE